MSHVEFNKFWLPITIFSSGYLVHEVTMNHLYMHFKYKYFLAPHMRFEINTGKKLDLILLVDKKQLEDDIDKKEEKAETNESTVD